MRFCSLVVCAMLAGQVQALGEDYVRNNADLLWKSFKDSYNRKYVTAQEETTRFRIFKQNMLEAARLEAMQPAGGATFGIGPFSDLTPEEFKVYHSLEARDIPSPENIYTDAQVKAADDKKDWREAGAVTHVKNQEQCGSCWAFSATGSIEGAWKLAGHDLTAVSEQELVSCDRTDNGCRGGLPENAFQWLINSRRGQIVTEESYPYRSGTGINHQCEDLSTKTVGATITNHQRLPHNEDQMKTWISTNGPASIGVDASRFQSYRGGILSNCCEGARCRLDHGVLIVGYDTSDSANSYWIIKNSWGPNWGENGYIRVKYGQQECGLNQDPTAPTA